MLSNFPSLTHCITTCTDIEAIIYSCSKLKYLCYSGFLSIRKLPVQNQNLKQLCIKAYPPNQIPTSFLQSVSAHSRLIHVVLCTRELFDDGVIALIGNSPKLLTCHIYADNFSTVLNYEKITLEVMMMMLKKLFSHRKLFTCGNFKLHKSSRDQLSKINNLLVEHNTSLWTVASYHSY